MLLNHEFVFLSNYIYCGPTMFGVLCFLKHGRDRGDSVMHLLRS